MPHTLLIGLDGATFTVLDPLFRCGDMPNLRSLLERGAFGELTSTRHFISPAAWTSLVTGQSPGCHGIFDFIYCRQTAEGVYFTLNMSYDIRCQTLWTIVSQQGMRVAALNFLVSYPPQPMNGVCVPGFIHARHLRQAVYPAAYYDKMKALLGDDINLLSMDMAEEFQAIQHLPAEEYEGWITHHIRREEQWFKITLAELQNDPPDLTAVVFDGVDKLQHLCWRFLDPTLFPSEPSPWESRIRDLCVSYFRQLDRFIGGLVAAAGPSARVFITSDHGFCATEKVFFANAWLAEQGHLYWSGEPGNGGSTQIASGRIGNQLDAIDFSRTRAFALNPSCNGIYIRRADGPGSPGVAPELYDGFRRQLVSELAAVADPYSGGPFFREVLTREAAFPGSHAARAPDITLVMQDYGFLSVERSDEVFRRRTEPWGTHHPQGIFIAAGPGIAPCGRIDGLNIIDVAPILLRSLELPPAPDMEGGCPAELFDVPLPRHAARDHWPDDGGRIGFAAAPAGADDAVPDADVEAEVLRRLRELNYLA